MDLAVQARRYAVVAAVICGLLTQAPILLPDPLLQRSEDSPAPQSKRKLSDQLRMGDDAAQRASCPDPDHVAVRIQ